MSVLLSSVESGLSYRHREVNENYLHLTWGIAAGMGINLAWIPSIATRHLSAELMSSDEIKKCHPETRQVKRNF